MVNAFYGALTKAEWSQYYNEIANKGYLEKVNVGDVITVVVGNKILFSERMLKGKDAHDFQVLDAFKISREYQDIFEHIEDVIVKEGVFSAKQTEKTVNRIIQQYSIDEILEQYSRNSGSYVNYISERENANGIRKLLGNNQNKTDRTEVQNGNKQNIQRTKAELEDSAFSIAENFKRYKIT